MPSWSGSQFRPRIQHIRHHHSFLRLRAPDCTPSPQYQSKEIDRGQSRRQSSLAMSGSPRTCSYDNHWPSNRSYSSNNNLSHLGSCRSSGPRKSSYQFFNISNTSIYTSWIGRISETCQETAQVPKNGQKRREGWKASCFTRVPIRRLDCILNPLNNHRAPFDNMTCTPLGISENKTKDIIKNKIAPAIGQ